MLPSNNSYIMKTYLFGELGGWGIFYTLSIGKKQERVQFSTELLEFLEARAPRELVNIYTGDETWVHYDNPRSSMRVGVDVERPVWGDDPLERKNR
jgi:hypothetical protein